MREIRGVRWTHSATIIGSGADKAVPQTTGSAPRTGDRSPNGRGVTCRRIATTVPTTLLTASAPPTRGDSEHRKDDHEYRAQLVGLIVDGHGLPGGSNADEMPIGVVVIDIDADVRWRVLYSAASSEADVAEPTTYDQAGCRMTSAEVVVAGGLSASVSGNRSGSDVEERVAEDVFSQLQPESGCLGLRSQH